MAIPHKRLNSNIICSNIFQRHIGCDILDPFAFSRSTSRRVNSRGFSLESYSFSVWISFPLFTRHFSLVTMMVLIIEWWSSPESVTKSEQLKAYYRWSHRFRCCVIFVAPYFAWQFWHSKWGDGKVWLLQCFFCLDRHLIDRVNGVHITSSEHTPANSTLLALSQSAVQKTLPVRHHWQVWQEPCCHLYLPKTLLFQILDFRLSSENRLPPFSTLARQSIPVQYALNEWNFLEHRGQI